MRIIKGKPGQTIFDLALEGYGSVEGIGLILQENTSLVELSDPIDLKIILTDSYLNKTNVDQVFNKVIPTSE